MATIRSRLEPDLDLPALDAHLIGRLGHAGRTVDDTSVVQAEHALVPWALDRAVLVVDVPLLERAPGVAAPAPMAQMLPFER
jgi:hypothetical protein